MKGDDIPGEDGPSAWLIRAGEHGEAEQLALREGRTVVGWSNLGALTSGMTRAEIRAQIQDAYGETRSSSLGQQAGVLYRFLHDVQIGDLVVLPMQTALDRAAVGWVTGEYEFIDTPAYLASDAVNTRTVDWITTDTPTHRFASDIRAALKLQGTLRKIAAPHAASRIVAAIEAPAQPIHLVVKWSAKYGPDTVAEHLQVARELGSVWWGLRGTPARPKLGPETIARVRAQLSAGEETRAFLSGQTCWRTSLLDIATTREEVDPKLIPSSYVDGQEFGLWIKIADFAEGASRGHRHSRGGRRHATDRVR